ncbi:TlpA family protein disulfide reductase [Paenibacillus thalictri]|uniref:TlpA family protein disulfide reductase n=1 Tax=Paenibacillus thalictri TaxID=2527873 RepID=A0A4Q9DZY5_9BACL|nr:TlpA family protein disulfide reductase [Paenibacillus thalictri]
MKRNLIVCLLIIALAGFAVYEHMSVSSAKESTAAGFDEPATEQLQKPAPSFTLKSLDGTSYTVGGPREKPLIVNFWASWCDPCHQEAPDLKKIADQYKNDLDFYAVNVTKGDTEKNAKDFVKQYDFKMPVLMDMDGKVSEQYRVLFIPTTYLIDRDGTIREVVHVLTPQQWEKKIKALLKK